MTLVAKTTKDRIANNLGMPGWTAALGELNVRSPANAPQFNLQSSSMYRGCIPWDRLAPGAPTFLRTTGDATWVNDCD